MVDPATLLADPAWLAHRYVEDDQAFRFVRLTREAHRAVPFIIDTHIGDAEIGGDVPLAQCLAQPIAGPLHYLFHSAFCGSTMLVRALDHPGVAMGMSEPQALNDVVGLRQRGGDPQLVAGVADAALRLLARPFEPGECVIVKPSNVINPLAKMLMGLRPEARAVFLHAPLETFLVSVANKGLHCRIWVRELLGRYIREGVIAPLGFTPDDCLKLADLQAAAVGWLAQQRIFAQISDSFGPRLVSLDADIMLKRPEAALAAVAGHYGLPLDSEAILSIVNGSAFSRHSKSGEAYSADRRAADYAQVRAAHGDEIDMVLVWAKTVAGNAGVSMQAPAPLLA